MNRRRGAALAVPHDSSDSLRSPALPTSAGQFSCPTSKRERLAGTGLSRRGPRESAARLDPFPLSRGSLMTTYPRSAAACAAAPLPSRHSLRRRRRLRRPRELLLPHLERGQRVDAAMLRAAMETAFGASDADGAWDWKTAYDACEAATVLFLRKFGPAMRAQAASPAAMLPMLAKIAGLLPTHTRRSEESQALQQFSTPIAARPRGERRRRDHAGRLVLEPSAGTGLLAILAETRRRLARSQRTGRNARRASRPSLSRHRRHPLRRRADRRSSRRRHRAERRADEPAVLGDRECRSPHGRRRLSPYRLGAWRVSPRAGGWSRSPARTSRPTIRPGPTPSSGCRSAGAIVFTAADRRRGLCQAWHDDRHAPDRDRPSARGRSDAVSGLARRRARCRHAARLDRRASFRRGCRSQHASRHAGHRSVLPTPRTVRAFAPRRCRPVPAAIAEPRGGRTRL